MINTHQYRITGKWRYAPGMMIVCGEADISRWLELFQGIYDTVSITPLCKESPTNVTTVTT